MGGGLGPRASKLGYEEPGRKELKTKRAHWLWKKRARMAQSPKRERRAQSPTLTEGRGM